MGASQPRALTSLILVGWPLLGSNLHARAGRLAPLLGLVPEWSWPEEMAALLLAMIGVAVSSASAIMAARSASTARQASVARRGTPTGAENEKKRNEEMTKKKKKKKKKMMMMGEDDDEDG